jgi:hypothetical protein
VVGGTDERSKVVLLLFWFLVFVLTLPRFLLMMMIDDGHDRNPLVFCPPPLLKSNFNYFEKLALTVCQYEL